METSSPNPQSPQVEVNIPRQCHLVYKSGPLAGTSLPINGSRVTIGKGAGNDIVIADDCLAPSHAMVTRDGDGSCTVWRLRTAYPVIVNGQSVASHVFKDHDVFQLGDAIIEFEAVSQPPRMPEEPVAPTQLPATRSPEHPVFRAIKARWLFLVFAAFFIVSCLYNGWWWYRLYWIQDVTNAQASLAAERWHLHNEHFNIYHAINDTLVDNVTNVFEGYKALKELGNYKPSDPAVTTNAFLNALRELSTKGTITNYPAMEEDVHACLYAQYLTERFGGTTTRAQVMCGLSLGVFIVCLEFVFIRHKVNGKLVIFMTIVFGVGVGFALPTLANWATAIRDALLR